MYPVVAGEDEDDKEDEEEPEIIPGILCKIKF
jgi:hypothetical protein